jgi:hypothetical protein
MQSCNSLTLLRHITFLIYSQLQPFFIPATRSFIPSFIGALWGFKLRRVEGVAQMLKGREEGLIRGRTFGGELILLV